MVSTHHKLGGGDQIKKECQLKSPADVILFSTADTKTLELYSHLQKIPNDTYTTLSQNLIGRSTLHQILKAGSLISGNNENAALNTIIPYMCMDNGTEIVTLMMTNCE